MLDSAHKAISPSTYDCALCSITHGVFSEREQWKAYRESSEHEFLFLHRDEFQRQFRSKWLPKFSFPIVLEAGSEGLQVLISNEELAEMAQPQELIDLINGRILPG
ncbi:hypothetical protein BST85_01225 [Aureitalea marina]|uniref:GTPase n=2 Tax=Aureitalea marina TaxID=930804 RepID=A0A2S7KTQ1_9FLAO|nr:hypothetical protein BST85_01225 [Aureitalea marina]